MDKLFRFTFNSLPYYYTYDKYAENIYTQQIPQSN